MYGYGGGPSVELARNCNGILIPEGTPLELVAGQVVYITQVLGGMFTVESEEGYLVRIDGLDADALHQPVPEERLAQKLHLNSQAPIEELVESQLRSCYDPEIPVNIVELGLIYETQILPLPDQTYAVHIQMTLTAPGCGMGEVLMQDVKERLFEIPRVSQVEVELVFDPPWDQSMMSEVAKLHLGMG